MDKSSYDEIKKPAEGNKPSYEGSFWNFSDKDTTEIQREIKITRADLDETVNALQARLAPQQMFNHFADMARESLNDFAPRLAETIRSNPLPTALTALGLGWLFYRNVSPAPQPRRRVFEGYAGEEEAYPYSPERPVSATDLSDEAGEVVSDVQQWAGSTSQKVKGTASRIKDKAREKAGDLAASTREKAGQLADSTKEKASRMVDYTRQKAGDLTDATMEKAGEMAHKAKQGVQALGHSTRVQMNRAGHSTYETFRENPLAFAIACVGIGAAVALSLPSTRTEREMMGQASDRLVDQAKSTGREALEKVQHVAQAGAQAVAEEARQEGLA